VLPGGTLPDVADRPRPPLADSPNPGKLPPSAGRHSDSESAIHETSGREGPGPEQPPYGNQAWKPSAGDATKSYNLDELKRLREMSHQPSDPSGMDDDPDLEDDDEGATSRINLADQKWMFALASGQPEPELEPEPEEEPDTETGIEDEEESEEQTTNRMNLRVRAANKPVAREQPSAGPLIARPLAGRRDIPTRPELGGGTTVGFPTPAPPRGRASPIFDVSDLPEIDDEDSNDEGSTVRQGKKTDFAAERAVLARGRVEPPALVDMEDDPLDDGPTRMRPPSEVAQGAVTIAAGMRKVPAAVAPAAARPPDGPAAKLGPRGNTTIPLPPSPGWGNEGRSSSVPPRVQPIGLARLASTQPLAPVPPQSPAPVPPPPVNASPVPPPPVTPPPVSPGLSGMGNLSPSNLPPVGSPWGSPPVNTPSLGSPALQPPASSPGRQRLIAALVGVALGLVVLFIYGIFAETEPVAPSAPPPTASATVAASPLPTASAPAATAAGTPGAVPMDAAEREARAALSKLREGISACVERGAFALPETADAVPSSLKLTRPDGYMPKADEWKAMVWVCARWNPTESMHYQLQWQSEKPFQEGVAVAWIDSGGDGNADRALSFRATLKSRGKVELSEVGPIDANHKVIAKP
jgi:hypothetical protein